jgi:predicted ATPase
MGQVLCPTLIGRQEETDFLRGALARAEVKQGGLVFVTGEAGIGKSRLAREAADRASGAGFVVMWGRAAAGPTPTPFRPLAEAILSVLRTSGPPDAEELTPYRPFLGRLVPEWGMPVPVEQSLVLVGEAVLRLLRVVAGGRGCLIVLEDLHWADPETLAVVEYLADNLRAEPVLCVATARLGEASPGATLARSLGGRRAATLVELTPLSSEETERMASACLAAAELPATLRDVLLASAEGVPFLVEELLAAWAGDGVLSRRESGWAVSGSVAPVVPLSFAEMVTRRIATLGEETRSVLQAAAVLGRRFDWSLLPAITGLTEGHWTRSGRAWTRSSSRSSGKTEPSASGSAMR